MAKTVDELVIEIKADTKQLKKELKQIEGKIRTTGAAGGAAFGSMAGGLSKVKGVAAGVVATLVIVGATITKIAKVGAGFEDLKDSLNQVFGSIEAGDAAMQKIFTFAQTTPFQIEDATKAFIALKSAGIEPSMEQLQTFADTASVSVDQLGTFEALIRMVQRSASGGMGLEELNMISDKGIDVLGILKDKLNLTKDDIAKFGKTAEGAAQMVAALTEGLNEKFGGAMEAKMDNLSTKTSNMVIAFKQLSDEIYTSGLDVALKGIADRFTDIANAMSAAIRLSKGEATLDDLLLGHLDPEDQQMALQQMIDTSRAAINQYKTDVEENSKKMAEAATEGVITSDYMTPIDTIDLEEEKNKLASYLRLLTTLNNADEEAVRKSSSKFKTDEKFKPDPKFVNFLAPLKTLANAAADPLVEINDQIAMLQEVLASDDLAKFEEFFGLSEEELQGVVTHLGVVKEELGKTSEATDEMAQVLENAVDTFANNFVDALMDGQNAMIAFRDLVGDMIQQVIAEFLKMQVIKPMMNALLTAVGLPTMPAARAGGGTVQGGHATLVGERGPEIFVPNTGGTVMNNMNSKNAMGGGGTTVINQSINFATGIVPTVRAEVMQMMPQIADVTKAAVQESAMRGGTFRRSLQGG